MQIDLNKFLQDQFKLSEFRPGQKEILQSLLQEKSALGLMPTGSGKSLVYQMFSGIKEGLTLCVTPLIALMEDQSQKAFQFGLKASFIHSQVPNDEKKKRLEALGRDEYRLFFVTPERLQKPEFQKAIENLKVSLFVVDEAHCISLWGHDFRPDYAKLGEFRQKLKNPPVLALTATATPDVQIEILKSLHIPETAVFTTGLKRTNLEIKIEEVYGLESKLEILIPKLAESDGAQLIYVTLIRTAEEVFHLLRKKGLQPLIYHGDLPPQKRKQSFRAFMGEAKPIMVATPAFGLGIDKTNIRSVFHLEPPASVESYYQEIGRAGRDGLPSTALFLYDQEDLTIPMQFIKSAHPEAGFIQKIFDLIKSQPDRVKSEGVEFLTEQVSFKNRSDHRVSSALNILERWGCITQNNDRIEFANELDPELFKTENQEELMKHHNKKLYSLVQWIRNQEVCRLKQIYQYFGAEESEDCGLCDVCKGEIKP